MSVRLCGVVSFFALIAAVPAPAAERPPTLEQTLLDRDPAELAADARVFGDPARGAVIFHRQGLGCTQCHAAGQALGELPAQDPATSLAAMRVGPDLAEWPRRPDDVFGYLVASILHPSRDLRDGYRTQTVLTDEGRILTGVVRDETDDTLTLAVPGEAEPVAIPTDAIDGRKPAPSLMPAGLVNQLADESEFHDLVGFLAELMHAGPSGSRGLRPHPSELIPPPLPAYESDLDHAGLIADWDDESLARGEAVFASVCVNCHGTKDEPGSLPNALRFASGKFNHGADPLTMYKTLTHGFRQMQAQRQLVPQQKYDVIHYIRETLLRPHNPSQLVPVSEPYLASLPAGTLRGPEPSESQPWREMDYGPFQIHTYEIVGDDAAPRPRLTRAERDDAWRAKWAADEVWPADTNFAYKGIAVRLAGDDPKRGADGSLPPNVSPGGIAAGSHWVAFDHDTMRVAGAWSHDGQEAADGAGDRFIDWAGILYDERHNVQPRTVGERHFGSLPSPGWANPATGSFDDPRFVARDGRAYGPLPRSWARYRGLYRHGDRVVLSYTVGDADVLESHAVDASAGIWTRTLNVGRSGDDLTMRLAPADQVDAAVGGGLAVTEADGYAVVRIPAAKTPIRFDVLLAKRGRSVTAPAGEAEDLSPLTHGGPPLWPQTLETTPAIGPDVGPFTFDTLVRPTDNPWNSRLRPSGLDFLPGEDALIACCADGDVWRVENVRDLSQPTRWRRIAAGLFEPLGVKVIGGAIHVGCRDQIVVLRDLNGDGETDFYECLNNDHQVTDHYHEFACDLQTDAAGNLYYAKCARHDHDSLVPQHGTLLRVSPDGETTEILANGFRAPNGVCLNPDGTFIVTDQEGNWVPMNRINRVREGGFYGNLYSYGAPDDQSDDAMQPPICWPNKPFDRSPAQTLWLDHDRWGPLAGSLLSLSYGYGKAFVVPHRPTSTGDWQGGMCRLRLPEFPTGVMRGRLDPATGDLFACGMYAWASNQSESPGGLYRMRPTGRAMHLPTAIAPRDGRLDLTFTEPLSRDVDPRDLRIESWSLRRTFEYGSDRYDERTLEVTDASVLDDGRTLRLAVPHLAPAQCMQIAYRLRDADGAAFTGVIQSTVHELGASE